jgi:hypothetical protein
LAQCAGVGCGLVRVIAGEEWARKVFSLEGPPRDVETSRLGSRDPVDGGTMCRPHGGETSKTKSWTIRRTVSWFGPQNQVRRPNVKDQMATRGGGGSE